MTDTGVPMTLTQALGALHRAGRIRSPWLPGMLVVHDYPAEDEHPPGQLRYRMSGEGEHCIGYLPWDPPEVEVTPDLTDAATVGCLLSLLREATGELATSALWDRRTSSWWVANSDTELDGNTEGDTEAAAIEAALLALASALPAEHPAGGGGE